jgi:hypothetical protein
MAYLGNEPDVIKTAETVTNTANNTTNETVYLVFSDTQGATTALETDSSLTYNPSTNLLTTAGNVDASHVNVTNSVQADNVNGNTGTFAGNVTASHFVGTATQAIYADLAEKYVADKDYEPGSIMVIGGDKEVTASSSYMDPAVAGVVSTNPAFLMNKDLTAEHVVDLALTGRVPCKVHGKIQRGDMIVSGNIAGVGTSCTAPKFGTVLGKALESYDSETVGIIEVITGRL